MTGKLADTVMAVRNGEQLARKYQPVVFNPSTPAQVEVRSKLKLLSQLSAVFGRTIAIRRDGNVSSRNMFTKINYPLVSYSSNEAQITLGDVQLTKSAVGFPNITVTRGEGAAISAELSGPAYELSRVIYIVVEKETNGTLRLRGSEVVNTPGVGFTFPTDLFASNKECVVYAYGIRDNNDAARAKFGNLEASTAETIATLISTRVLTDADITLTETKSATVAAV